MQPAELGRYRIDGVIGRGGMGVVYDAYDPQIDRAVAIKTIALDALSDHERAMFEGRFRAEMRSAGRLQHHNIAALYDTGRDGGTAYIVMERVTGHDLKRRMAAGERYTLTQVLDIALQLLAALEFAHRHQVIHRDVKPANVMLQPDGTVKLCDFGVARLADSDATRTQGMIVGSLRYASPEQISGKPIDARTDVFSTGVLLFELLTGQLPFHGQTDVEVLHRIAHEAAPSLRSIDPQIPPEVDAAIRKALAKDPLDRFASAAEFARALGGSSVAAMETLPSAGVSRPAALSPTGPGTTSPTVTQALAPDAGRSRRGAMATAIGAGVLVLGAGAWWGLRSPAPAVTAQAPPPPQIRPQPAPQPAPAPAPVSNAVAPAPAPAPGPAAPAPSPAPPPAAPPVASPAPAPAPSPVPAPAPKAAPAAPRPAAIRVAEGTWIGHLTCGASLTAGNTGPRAQPFKSAATIEVAGQRLTWTRSASDFSESMTGSFDAKGAFTIEGGGSYKGGASPWRGQASGQFLPQASRIEGRAQLLRPDGFVTRECTLAFEFGAASASAKGTPAAGADKPPAAKPATPEPATAKAPSIQGAWAGLLTCSALINPAKNTTRIEGFSNAKLKLEIAGSKVSWVRETATALETASGKVDSSGRFTVEGEGASKDAADRRPWLLKASGEVLAREQRIDARAQILRHKEGTIARECTMRAVRP